MATKTLPTVDELGKIYEDLGKSTEYVELLAMLLSRCVSGYDDLEVEMTPADAWRLILFARDLKREGEFLVDWAKDIDHAVEYLMTERQAEVA